MFHIDKSKLKPNMIIHTPTLEKARAVCEAIGSNRFNAFNEYEKDTCINTNEGNRCSYGNTRYYKEKGLIITPFEDILDWKTILTTTKSAVVVSTIDEITAIANLTGFTNGDWDIWLRKHNPLAISVAMSTDKTVSGSFCYPEWYTDNDYTLYSYSDIFQRKQQCKNT